MKVCAIIPAFNEERFIAGVVRGVREQGLPVLVVDDCSRDATSERARAAGAEVVRHDTNRGKGAALATGFAWAREHGFEAAVTLDGDGQHDPRELGAFLETAVRERADIVVGSRFLGRGARGMPPVRKLTNRFMSGVLSFMAGRRLTDTQSGYRLIRVAVWDALAVSSTRFDAESEMLVRACRTGMRVAEVPIRTIYGEEASSMRPVRDTLRWIGLLVRLWREGRRRRRAAAGLRGDPARRAFPT